MHLIRYDFTHFICRKRSENWLTIFEFEYTTKGKYFWSFFYHVAYRSKTFYKRNMVNLAMIRRDIRKKRAVLSLRRENLICTSWCNPTQFNPAVSTPCADNYQQLNMNNKCEPNHTFCPADSSATPIWW